MEIEKEEKKKPIKHYQCKQCKKKYTRWGAWMNRHITKTGHSKFKKINDGGGFLIDYG